MRPLDVLVRLRGEGGRSPPCKCDRRVPQTIVVRCLYCLEEKAATAFNREHVLNEAFGTFDGNLVLRCVCRDCNDKFGRSFDRKIARDSIESVERVRRGALAFKDFKGEGLRTTTRVRFDRSGPLRGALGRYFPLSDGPGLACVPRPQVGFSASGSSEIDWYPLDEIPGPSAVGVKLRLVTGDPYEIHVQGASLVEAQRALAARGYENLPTPIEQPAYSGPVQVQITFSVDSPELRAVTKMALSYLAATRGAPFALQPQFNEARRFVLTGDDPARPLVAPIVNPWVVRRESDGRRPDGHFIAVRSYKGQLVVAQVSLFLQLNYVVYLARGAFAVPVHLRSGHFFDRDRHLVSEIDPPPIHRIGSFPGPIPGAPRFRRTGRSARR